MNESLLHHVWKFQLFNASDLRTTQGDRVQVIRPGEYNTNAGPDFFNARIACNDLVLAGNVEVHLRSSDWNRHHHETDQSYQNIILHVVLTDDAPVMSNTNEHVLTIELRHRIPKVVIDRYEDLQQLNAFIPCEQHWSHIDEFTRRAWLNRMCIERLEQKCIAVQELLDEHHGHWENAFFIALARNFGFRINAVPFELVAKNIPLKLFSKSTRSLLQIEALLFGVAGFLDDSRINDPYYVDLRREFAFLKNKHSLKVIDVSLWKLLRLRPANFPQLRLAQFAALIHRSVHLLSKVTAQKSAGDIKNLMSAMPAPFWDTHYTFRNSSVVKKKMIGEDALDNILINTVIPFLFLYGKANMREELNDLALDLLEKIKPEKNHIITQWEALGTQVKHAGHTQALLQLRKHYCEAKRCLECGIGLKILKEI